MINLLVVNWTMSICRSDSFNYSIFQILGTIDLITLWKEIRYAMARFSFFCTGVSPEWLQYIAWWRFTICLLHQSRACCVMRLQICKHTRLLLTHRFMQLSLLIFSLQGKCNLSAITVTSTSDCPFWPAKVMTRKLTWVNMLIVGFGRFVYLSVIKVNLIMFRSMSGRTIGLPSASGRCVVSLFAHWHFPLLIS